MFEQIKERILTLEYSFHKMHETLENLTKCVDGLVEDMNRNEETLQVVADVVYGVRDGLESTTKDLSDLENLVDKIDGIVADIAPFIDTFRGV